MPDLSAFVREVTIADLIELSTDCPRTVEQVMASWIEARKVTAGGAVPPASPADCKRWRELLTDVCVAQLAVAMARQHRREGAHGTP